MPAWMAEDQLFATLDPTLRRLEIPDAGILCWPIQWALCA